MPKKTRKNLYLIDGTALAYRSYFAFIKNPLINSRGMNTSAVYGFALVLARILREVKPDYVGIVFDSKEPTFRHEKYEEYKATREKMPDEMADQLPFIERLVDALSIPFIASPTYEADDIMATLAKKCSKDLDVFLVSGDKDLMQLVNERIKLYIPKKAGEVDIVGHGGVVKKFGVPPEKIVDLFSLMGDSSDNVPGVPGIGQKTALKLLEDFSSLDEILKNTDKVEKKKICQSLKENKKLAMLSKELVTLDTKVPLKIGLKDLKIKNPDIPALSDLCNELEFHTLVEKFDFANTLSKEKGSAQYILVNSSKKLKELIMQLEKKEEFVFDTETTSLNPHEAKIVGISYSFKKAMAYYLPFNLMNREKEFSYKSLIKLLKPFFENPEIKKGGHNVKYDALVLRSSGIEVKGISFDTMIESYLLDPSARQHNLNVLSLKHLNQKMIPIEEIIGKGSSRISMLDADIQQVSDYSCEDSDITLKLHSLFTPEIKKTGLKKLYEEVEMPLLDVLKDIEWEGIKIDAKFLSSISKKVNKDLEKLETEIHKEAGEKFNINSPKQLGRILFEKLKVHETLGIKRIKKTKTGYSTNSQVLENLSDHPIANKILGFRNLSKLKSTYLDSLPELISEKTGRVHTSFNQTVTATGRLSSSDPNLQNIPIRTELGRKIRKAFVPKDKNSSIISADYSQIELRILAHLSKDKNLIQTFKDGVDVHLRTASKVFDIPEGKVDHGLRSRAKAINFGIIYGMGPQRLARETKISFEEAQSFIDNYFDKYPGIKSFIDDQIDFASKNGFVTTLLGRRRQIPEIDSPNPRLRINAEHIAVNTPIQGSAADMIKVAMINIHRIMKKRFFDSKMILQVHDELVFEATNNELDELMEIIKHEMENAMKLEVPVKVDIKSGKSWFEAH